MPVRRQPPKQPFEIRDSSIQGRGAFALRRIKKGQRIIEYTGERICDEEAYTRYDDTTMKRHHTFLFMVDDDLSIDGAAGGNDARYINHSCEPNCEAWIEDGDRVFIYAKKDIAPGVELTYDYAYVGVDARDPEVRAMYVCHCGSPKCRGSIVQPPPKRKKRASGTRDEERRSRRMAS
jgi:SET domain-containing protein